MEIQKMEVGFVIITECVSSFSAYKLITGLS